MSGLVSGVGLISGLPIQDIIDQLIAVQSRPYLRTLERIQKLQVKRSSYSTLNEKLLAMKSAASEFDEVSFFRRSKAVSSNPGVLSASAADNAIQGSFKFRVQSLVASHQLISEGFSDADQTAVGGGTITIEIGQGQLSPTTFLDDLHAGSGVGRGIIEIQDRSGQTAQIDLTSILTVDDVLNKINNDPRVSVRAHTSGDAIVLQDLTGSSDGNLTVFDLGSGTTARDLGILQSVSGDTLIGLDINNVSSKTKLSLLNDGNGVRHNQAGADLIFVDESSVELFSVALNDTLRLTTHLEQLNDGQGVGLGEMRVSTQSGDEFTVDLSAQYDFQDGLGPRSVQTIGDVIFAINQSAAASGIEVVAQQEPGTQLLQLVDNTSGDNTFELIDLTGSSANDLGLTTEVQDGKITAAQALRLSSLGDVVRAINFAEGNFDLSSGTSQITAEISDNGLLITQASGVGFAVQAGNGSLAADDLGILANSTAGELSSRSLIAGINTVLLRSLNGGQGVSTQNELIIQDKLGLEHHIDLAGAVTMQDVLEAINSQSGIQAELNTAQNGVRLIDETSGGGTLSVVDNQTAADLGLGGGLSTSDDQLVGQNLQLQYVSEATLLETLNQGAGIGLGDFRVTTSEGQLFTVSVSKNQRTVGEVINQINNAGAQLGIEARINDNGDGIVVIDSSGGAGELKIEDRDGAVAAQLNLLRDSSTDGTEQAIDGSFELHITIDADDTLNDVSEKINSAGLNISATVISDGSSANPFRISITSKVTGTAGELMFDTGATGLVMSDLVKPQDAVLFFGGADSTKPLVIRSSSNTLTNVVQNVTINLLATSDEEVELTIARDTDSIVDSINTFVSTYNDVIDLIDELTFFDAESFESGVLRGESTVNTIQTRLRGMINSRLTSDDAAIRRLSSVGIRFSGGGQLEFDEAEFREKFGEDPQAVEALFALFETVPELDSNGNPVINPNTGEQLQEFVGLGIGFQIDEMLEALTRSFDGVLARTDDTLRRQGDLLSDRADFLLSLLDSRRRRLESQFAGLEQALNSLTSQQSALGALGGVVGAFGR